MQDGSQLSGERRMEQVIRPAYQGFGTDFMEAMIVAETDSVDGWKKPVFCEYTGVTLPLASPAVQYGYDVFDAFQAHPQPDGSLAFFRMSSHLERLNKSAATMGMPKISLEPFSQSLRQLASTIAHKGSNDGERLYFRVNLFPIDQRLGLQQPTQYRVTAMASKGASYFADDDKARVVWIEETQARVPPGGKGSAKCSAFYAPTFADRKAAEEKGCTNVLYLNPSGERLIEEFDMMNIIFVLHDGSLITPALNGNILDGVTRDCIMTLARDEGRRVTESSYTITELVANVKNGKVTEIMGTGTAAAVVGIGECRMNDVPSLLIGDGKEGPLTKEYRRRLQGHQRGTLQDRHGWREHLP